MKKILLPVLLLAAACGPMDRDNGGAVRVADATNVWRCKAIGEVAGETRGGTASPNALRNARADAMNEAARMGADTIVWKKDATGMATGANGIVYNCQH